MAQITLELDHEALREATAQAVVGVLTPEVRKQVLEAAVETVLAPQKNQYGRVTDQRSPLQTAFDKVVLTVAHEEAERAVRENPELLARIREQVRAAADKAVTIEPDRLGDVLSRVFAHGLRESG